MSELCPKCGRVAQKSRPTCLYCGAPLEAPAAGERPTEAAAERGPEPTPPAAPAAPETAPAAEASSPAPAAPARAPFRPSPPRASAQAPSVLSSWFLWVVLVLAAVVVGALVAGGSDEEEPIASAPATTSPEEALRLAAEGLAPESEPPDVPSADLLETRTERARGSMALVSQWIESYAGEYGHYPAALGVELDALTQFSDGADMEWVLAPFEGERLEYLRSVAPGGEEESYELSAVVRGTDGREVTARGSRRRGGDPRNPAPLGPGRP